MFLNKQDLLKSKVLEGRFKIETYFPEYTNYQTTSDSESDVWWLKLSVETNFVNIFEHPQENSKCIIAIPLKVTNL